MNTAIGTRNRTMNGLKGRYLAGVAGIALATGIAIAGATTLSQSEPRTAVGGVSVAPQFATMADAVDALPVPSSSEVLLSQAAPQFATMADAVDALPVPAAQHVSQPEPLFANVVDAIEASLDGFSVPYIPNQGEGEDNGPSAYPLVQEISNP